MAREYTVAKRGSYVSVSCKQYDMTLVDTLDKAFSYEDKNAYFIRKSGSRWDGIYHLFHKGSMSVGIGFFQRLIIVLRAFEKQAGREEPTIRVIEMDVPSTPAFEPGVAKHAKEAREYQQQAIDAVLKNRVGVLQLATGSGKSMIAAELTRQLKMHTLFLVDRKELLHQAKKAMERQLGVKVGVVGDDEENILPVTVATIQTVSKRLKQYERWLAGVQFLIVDECHIAAAKTVKDVCKACTNTVIRLGLSATCYRSDGHDMLIEESVGPIIMNISLKSLAAMGFATPPTIEFWEYESYPVQAENYKLEYDFVVKNNTKRDACILSQVERFRGRKILILTKLVEHGALLQSKIVGSIHIHGSKKKADRMKEWAAFVEGKDGVCVATMSIASKGLDIPDLGVIINAGANKSDVSSIQALGRVVRALEGKKDAFYIDFVDPGKYCGRHSRKRMKAFATQGHEVVMKGG